MDSNGRLAGADFIRALACIMVLVHHLVLRIDLGRLPADLRYLFEIARFGNYGVALFFVLSGYLLSRPFWSAFDRDAPLPSLRIYTLRRAARILPGFWVALTIGFSLSLTVYGLVPNAELVIRYVAGFLMMSQWHWRTFFPVEGDGPLWSIPFEVTCYVLLPFGLALVFRLCRGPQRRSASRLAWCGIIAAVLLAHWLIVTAVPMDDVGRGWRYGIQGGAKEWMPRYNPIGFFAIFGLGMLAAGLRPLLPKTRSALFDLAGLAALIGIAAALVTSVGGEWEGYGLLSIPYRFPGLPLAVGAALCVLPGSVLLGRLLDNPVTRFVATVSFGIYIWQDIVISMLVHLFPGAFGIGTDAMLSGWIVWSVIAVAVTVCIATLSYVCLERPVLRWARGLEARADAMPLSPIAAKADGQQR